MEKTVMITIELGYAVAMIGGFWYLVHQYDPRIAAIRVSVRNRAKINRLGEGHFVYADLILAAETLVELH